MKRLLRLAGLCALVLALGGCAMGDYYGKMFASYYDRLLGSAPVVKPTELEKFNPTATTKILWKESVGDAGQYILPPLADLDGVWVDDHAGHIVRFDAATGKKTNSINAGTELSSGVGGDGTLVLAGSSQGEVLAWNLEGKLLWKAQLTNEILSTPQMDQGVVIARSADNRVVALDAVTGASKWIYQRAVPALTVRTNAGVVIYRGGVFTGFPGGRLVVLVLENGTVGWEASVTLPRGATELERVADVASPVLIDSGQVCAVAFQGRVACFDLVSGSPRWARDISSVAGMAEDGRNLYISDEKSDLVVFDKSSGASVWKQDKLYGRQISAPVVIGDYIAVGDYQGYVHFLRREDGAFAARVETDGSPIVAQPIKTDHGIVVQTQKGGVFAIAVQ